jgi:2-polyprenyl-3-methyl-5-hydroxy-6-metoxy-1,4-benzoquinol methylase
MKKILRSLSTFIQGKQDSFKRHNAQYEAPGKFERDRDAGYENIKNDRINWADFKIRDVLAQHPGVKTAIDVGSGTGWVSASVHDLVGTVIALEPSAAAIDISRRAYPAEKYPNITWHQGFAEALLPTLTLTTPTIFITGCVLSHLRDQEVEKICQAIVAIAPAGSVFAFSECWSESEPWHQHMWHVRTKAWWQAQFPGWTLEFGGLKHDQGDYHMGIWGVKL